MCILSVNRPQQTIRQREGGAFNRKLWNFGSVKTWGISEGTDNPRNISWENIFVALVRGNHRNDDKVILCGVRLVTIADQSKEYSHLNFL
jgi:hypothetical protein